MNALALRPLYEPYGADLTAPPREPLTLCAPGSTLVLERFHGLAAPPRNKHSEVASDRAPPEIRDRWISATHQQFSGPQP